MRITVIRFLQPLTAVSSAVFAPSYVSYFAGGPACPVYIDLRGNLLSSLRADGTMGALGLIYHTAGGHWESPCV